MSGSICVALAARTNRKGVSQRECNVLLTADRAGGYGEPMARELRIPGLWTLSALPASLIWAADHILCSQAKGLTYTSPGQRPGFACGSILLQANGLPHTFHLSR